MYSGTPKQIANRIAKAPQGKKNTPTKRIATTATHSASHARLECCGAVLVRMTSISVGPPLPLHEGTEAARCQIERALPSGAR